jgi:indolepyruvate ferredoxin oxidoreductase alpha subunit
MRGAFEWSERFEIPFLLRVTRSAVQCEGPLVRRETDPAEHFKGYSGEGGRFVPIPSDVVQRHRRLQARLQEVAEWTHHAPGNRISGSGDLGVVAIGFASRKLRDVIGDDAPTTFRLLELASVFPLPASLLEALGRSCREVLILEEQRPLVEERLAALYHRAGTQTRVLGRMSGHVPGREGELFRWQIQQAMGGFVPEFNPAQSFSPDEESQEIPHKQDHCAGSGYDSVTVLMERVAEELGMRLLLVADPGCMVAMADRLVAKYAIGSAVAVAEGLSRTNPPGKPVAVIGDSAFFHSSLPALCHAARRGGDVLVVVLDNQGTRSTGGQPSMAAPRDARGEAAPALSIIELAAACGVGHVAVYAMSEDPGALRQGLKDALGQRGPALVHLVL